ncbi:MAG: sulfatase-like hydrolase/transferase [Planctomycetota bacterium]
MLAGVAALAPQLVAPAPQDAVRTPVATGRVLLVDIDDVGYDLLVDTPTPTLDWIAAHGRAFTRFVTAPSCSPTRAMLMTGAHASHPDLLLGQIIAPKLRYRMPIGPLEPLAQAVADAGCTTAKIGKWHLARRFETDHPHQCGWQHYSGVLSNVTGSDEGYLCYEKIVNGSSSWVRDRYLTTDETDDAIECVRAGFDLVSVSYHAPHRPWHVPPAHLHSIPDTTSERDQARAMLQACDRELGRLVRVATAAGYTILVFSDNGTAVRIGGGKGSVHDDGVVVPFLAIGPGVAPGIDRELVSVVDLYDTTLELLGVDATGPTRGPQSRSLVPALAGRPLGRTFAYTERFQGLGEDPRASNGWWHRAVRGTRFKLCSIRTRTALEISLYDVVADPDEAVDLLAAPLSPDAMGAYRRLMAVLAGL